MEREQHELYEYARKRIKQKKGLYFHFVLLFLLVNSFCIHVNTLGNMSIIFKHPKCSLVMFRKIFCLYQIFAPSETL